MRDASDYKRKFAAFEAANFLAGGLIATPLFISLSNFLRVAGTDEAVACDRRLYGQIQPPRIGNGRRFRRKHQVPERSGQHILFEKTNKLNKFNEIIDLPYENRL
jgi:hypothetical protein